MNVLEEFKPLYFDKYSIADLMGGRAGARSYSSTQHALYEVLHSSNPVRGFFLREVHSTIYSSMWADLKDRINEYQEIHKVDLSEKIQISDNKQGENTFINLENGNSITTKGFKVSSGNQTASLKSLAGATHVYIDEADEVAKKDFLKLRLSLRKKGADLKIIRAFNPPEKEHWIWNDYKLTALSNEEIIKIIQGLRGGEIKDIEERLKSNNKTYYKAIPRKKNHLCIQTNYSNNESNLNDEAIKAYNDLYEDDLDYYLVHIAGLIPNVGGEIIYYEYDKEENHTDRVVEDNDVLHVGMDFNITNMSAVIHVVDGKINKAVAEETKVFDTDQMCSILKEKYFKNKIVVYPDATGKGRKTSSGKSDFDIIRSYGFQIKSNDANPPVRNRINTVNSKLKSKELLVNRHTCPEYSQGLSKQKYKGGVPDKTSEYDHVNDAGGYFIAYDYSSERNKKLRF